MSKASLGGYGLLFGLQSGEDCTRRLWSVLCEHGGLFHFKNEEDCSRAQIVLGGHKPFYDGVDRYIASRVEKTALGGYELFFVGMEGYFTLKIKKTALGHR